MANSRKPGPTNPPMGMCKLPARTGGPLGLFDQADPNVTSLLGDTPGSLGVFDWAAVDLTRVSSLNRSLASNQCRAKDGSILAIAISQTDNSQNKKSGKHWVVWADKHAKNSNLIDDLESSFKANIKLFLKALTDAGATYSVSTTTRSAARAYLFHWSWKISQGKCKATDPSKMAGVDIDWDHGDQLTSKAAALEMVNGFGLAVPPKSTVAPSLTSNHIVGKAIDVTITWSKDIKIKKKDNTEVTVRYMADVNANTKLHEVGKSYGVIKHTSDAPHWSYNGR